MDRDAIRESAEGRVLAFALQHYRQFSREELSAKLENFSAFMARSKLRGEARGMHGLWGTACLRALRHLVLGEEL